ncbi:MAG: hypothetical protein ABI192_01930, partial [Bradyrhizobium sp.]
IPLHVRDDRETPLVWDGIAKNKPVIWVGCEALFFTRRLDRPTMLIGFNKIVWLKNVNHVSGGAIKRNGASCAAHARRLWTVGGDHTGPRHGLFASVALGSSRCAPNPGGYVCCWKEKTD